MKLLNINPKTAARKLRQYTRKLWVRVVGMGLMAFVALALAPLFNLLLPEDIGIELNGAASDRLLNIIANAMLAVTTFSLTVMVSVYRASSQQWTPRVHRLIIEDRTTQNTLAVFIGAYVYALTAIILRELGVFTDDSAPVLFFMTSLVLVGIVVALGRWVLHLQTFGSLMDTARQIETATSDCLRERLRNPCLGANPLTGDIPRGDSRLIRAAESGYVQHIYPEALQEAAESHGVEIFFAANIGEYVVVNAPLAYVRDRSSDAERETEYEDIDEALRANIVIGDVRTYDQDPRFGLITMGEVASRALSPGINDPGTAIDMITRISRVLTCYEDETEKDREDEVLDRLYVPPLDPGDLLEDALGSLTRDGIQMVEVQQRLQKALAGLMQHPDKELRKCARRAAVVALHRALLKMDFYRDRERLVASVEDDIRVEATTMMERERVEKLDRVTLS
ncbi:MAG: DUF2254 domain-containing protein [Sulfitobacter sp.]|nr:DUF2254 domain-containing protein [Sulfitobacter sp.]